MKTHKDFIVWQMSIDFVTEIYRFSKIFLKEENYGIINRLRRSAVSNPSNIAEGAARSSGKKFIKFLFIAMGSASEPETQLIICHNLKYLKHENYMKFIKNIIEIQKAISGLIVSVKKSLNNRKTLKNK